MTTDALRISAGGFWMRGAALWERVLRLGRRTPRRLRLCESLPLGERRFVAVVEFDRERFLLGGTTSSLVLLSRLEKADSRTENEAEETAWNSPAASEPKKQRGEKC